MWSEPGRGGRRRTPSRPRRSRHWPRRRRPGGSLASLRVHLKAITLRGFKSFVDPVEIRLEPGVSVVVGPNGSVISQGRVETVLNSKPAERRELVEEAAGLGRFKRRRHRAELKLSRVGVQVERARDLEDEVKKRLRPLALQATAAERAEKLGVEIAALQAAIATLDLARLAERRSATDARRATTAEERRV